MIYRRKIQNIFENRLNGILIHENGINRRLFYPIWKKSKFF